MNEYTSITGPPAPPMYDNNGLELPLDKAELSILRKSDVSKVQLAILLRTHTTVSNVWIAQKLAMGHPGSVSVENSLRSWGVEK